MKTDKEIEEALNTLFEVLDLEEILLDPVYQTQYSFPRMDTGIPARFHMALSCEFDSHS